MARNDSPASFQFGHKLQNGSSGVAKKLVDDFVVDISTLEFLQQMGQVAVFFP